MQRESDPMASAGQMDPGVGAGLGESLSIHGSTEQLNSSAVNRILMEFLMYFGKAMLVFYPVYLTGYLGLSISWVLLCMVLATWWKKNRQWKDTRIGTAIDFVDNETHMVNKELASALQMATWVHFPEIEKVGWVNKVLEQAWPFFGMYMDKLLRNNIQPAIRLSNNALKMFTFTKIHFGNVPLKITGMRAYTHEVDQREVVLDLHISYEGDVNINAVVKPPVTAGIKGLKLNGMLRVILQPLIGQAPLVGGVTYFFMRRPTLNINWTGTTNLLDSPAFSSLSEQTILDTISSLMVLPNRMCVPLIDQIQTDQMRFPLPRGVVRVHLLEARDLVAMDTYMRGLVKGKSDPYATLRVGTRNFKSKTIKETLNPVWNEVYEFVAHEAPGQELEMELYDEDTDKDDFLGRYNLDLGVVKKEVEMDKWFTLEGIQKGEVHLKLKWFSLKCDPSLLRESTDGLACAMLAVYLDNCSNLPKDHSEISELQKPGKPPKEARAIKKRTTLPNSFVELSIDKDIKKSKVAYASKDPAWEEGFTFFVHNVKTQQLLVQVKESEKKTTLGVLHLPLARLLNISDMTIDQRLPLERSGVNSQIKLKATLRILAVEKPLPKVTVNPPRQDKQQAPQTNKGASAPVSTPSATTSSSSALPHKTNPPAQTLSPALAAQTQNGSNETWQSPSSTSHMRRYDSQNPLSENSVASPANMRRYDSQSLLSENSLASAANMRRYDSHSMLSENSIASSRFDLSEGATYPEAIRNHQGSFGEIQLTVRYAALRKKLVVLVISCRNLFRFSENGTDSYVRLYFLPDQSWIHRKRTQVKKKTVNPLFNHKFEFDVTLQEAQTRKLDIAVKNGKMFHSRESKDIGMVLLDLSQLDIAKGITEWYELTLPGLKKFN
ncbi:extended synaptotagmin-3 isoform X2 [Etheostoma spectabile]|uniref:extended synaptotagmin-3 isoform X2 n=1 Tax=Etheostoma spectabile TaxID=54343 RepID=UPI0013AF47C1|nr:extended synaptotagmin-3-like isoform X2 [Etheostoma spectabile]